MEYTEEIKETLVKINDFIQENNDVNYKIRLLEREVPNLQELVKKLTIPVVVGQSEQLCEVCNNTEVSSRLFHVHNDIEYAAKWYKIPIALYDRDDVYIMQEDRCVFVGKPQQAVQFIERNEGKYCKSRFPL